MLTVEELESFYITLIDDLKRIAGAHVEYQAYVS